MKEGLPPTFILTGNEIITSIRVQGPHRQRDPSGKLQYLHWSIELKDYDGSQVAGRIGSVRYGEIPKGYVQTYPENGAAPPLVEGESYSVRFITTVAEHDSGRFAIKNGKVVFTRNE